MSNNIVENAFSYTKEGFVGKWMRWFLLLVCVFIQSITFNLVPLFNGYLLRVAGKNDSAPELNEWFKLFIDGWKLQLVEIVYMIPAIIIAVVFGIMVLVPELLVAASGGSLNIDLVIGMAASLAVLFLVIILIALFLFMAIIRLGQTGNFSEAFNFSAINKAISNGVGWIGYIGYCILLWILVIIYSIVMGILSFIPIVGFIIMLITAPLVSVFAAAYLRNIYLAGNPEN